jgi:hypothetical protein
VYYTVKWQLPGSAGEQPEAGGEIPKSKRRSSPSHCVETDRRLLCFCDRKLIPVCRSLSSKADRTIAKMKTLLEHSENFMIAKTIDT